jgi:hypothetical protein
LSQNFGQHGQDFLPAYRSALDQTDPQPDILDQRLVPNNPLGRRNPELGRVPWAMIAGCRGDAALVEGALLFLTLGVLIVGDTPSGGLLLAVGLTATEGTTQVLPPGIARVGQEENAAMPAALQAGAQVRLGSQN